MMAEINDSKAWATVRSAVIDVREKHRFSNVIEQIYDDALDVFLLRNAFPVDLLSGMAEQLDHDRNTISWARPNAVMPPDDIYILGTDTPATPTYKAPRGASLDSYLESA